MEVQWHDGNDECLRRFGELALAGLSAREIVLQLSDEFTEVPSFDRIRGLTRRAGVRPRLEQLLGETQVQAIERIFRARQSNPSHVEMSVPIVPVEAELHTGESRAGHFCKWPIGSPGSSGFRFCERSCSRKGPYCIEHRAVAYSTDTIEEAA